MPDDPFRRLNYRRLVAWPARIEREWPALQRILETVPDASVVDLGSGTGEHCRFLASKGVRSLGIDRSEEQVASAKEYEGESGDAGPLFVCGEINEVAKKTDQHFGLALSLGNVLPYLEDDALDLALDAIKQVLLPAGKLFVQLLNYERILDQDIRHLPLNFRPVPDQADGPQALREEIVWVRLMRRDGDKHVLFLPTTLKVQPAQDEAVVVHSARKVRLRAWRWEELEVRLKKHGFGQLQAFGDMLGGTFEGQKSHDLVFSATRP